MDTSPKRTLNHGPGATHKPDLSFNLSSADISFKETVECGPKLCPLIEKWRKRVEGGAGGGGSTEEEGEEGGFYLHLQVLRYLQ